MSGSSKEMMDMDQEIECACGCQEVFIRTRPHQRFISEEHQQKYWQRIRGKTSLLVNALGEQGVDRLLSTMEK